MDTTRRNSLICAGVLIVEAIILKLLKSLRLWIYIAIPIIAGFLIAEFYKPQPKKSKRNLK